MLLELASSLPVVRSTREKRVLAHEMPPVTNGVQPPRSKPMRPRRLASYSSSSLAVPVAVARYDSTRALSSCSNSEPSTSMPSISRDGK